MKLVTSSWDIMLFCDMSQVHDWLQYIDLIEESYISKEES